MCPTILDFKVKNQVIHLMITDGKKWHYLAVKLLPVLLKRITSKRDGDFYCLNCFHSYIQKINLKSMKMYVKIIIIAI